MLKYSIFLLSVCLSTMSFGQKDQFKAVSIGFYNLENLFDIEDDTLIRDEEFLPWGKRAWTKEKYEEKQNNMAYVISQMGIDVTPAGISLLGVSEIENKKVLEDLVKMNPIKERDYQIVHYDSPDKRGIDVGLLYNPKHFSLISSEPIHLDYTDGDYILYSRDILHVHGVLDGDSIHVLVNHWPSRSGGEKRSAPKRIRAAETVAKVVDSLKLADPNVKVIVMGDLNDDPTSKSVKSFLKAEGRKKNVESHEMFNPMHDYYRRGLGSNAYRDNWSLFDQIVLSPGLIDEKDQGYQFYKAIIFNKKYLIQRSGQYKGYPYRTFSGDKYQGGYSDHFPVFVYLVKKV